MKKLALTCSILACLYFASCKKNNDVISPVSLVGTWQSYQLGLDSNKNDVPEPNELKLVADTEYITFSSYGTFHLSSSSDSSDGNYTYVNDTINCLYRSSPSFQLYVHSITKDHLVCKVSTVKDRWVVYIRKQ